MKDDRQFASTLAKGLDVLRCFTPQNPVLSNKQLAEMTGMSRPTICRFTYTLQMLGYLRVDGRSGKYQLGSAVLSLGYPLLAATPLRQFARAAMDELAGAVNGTVSMGVRDRLNIVYVECSRSPGTTPVQWSEVGQSWPIVSGAIGRAWLAGCDGPTRESVLNEVRVKTPELWLLNQERVAKSLRQFARTGWCITLGELRPEVFAVGVPLGRLPDGELVAFNCTVQRQLVKPEDLERVVAPRLAAMVAQLRRAAQVI